MARKNNELDIFITIIVLATIWWIYKLFLEVSWFYQQHHILFFVISGFLIAGWLAIVYWLTIFLNNRRNKKWMAIERIEDMQKLHWREFEEFITFVLQKKWFRANIGTGTKDGWVDIAASLDWRKYLVQCKKWNKYKVSEPNLREFLWAISDFDIDAKWIYVTTSHLTSDAKIFAERNGISIWDKTSLEWYVAEFTGKETEKREEIKVESREEGRKCDKCGGNLIKRTAKQGSNKWNEFLGCENYPQCKNVVTL